VLVNIDQFAWSGGGGIKMQFPAQVSIFTRTHCLPIPESQFKSVISGNYHKFWDFYYELDHAQTRGLISLFKLGPVPYCSTSSSLQCCYVDHHVI
jgi:hypothetical protein